MVPPGAQLETVSYHSIAYSSIKSVEKSELLQEFMKWHFFQAQPKPQLNKVGLS